MNRRVMLQSGRGQLFGLIITLVLVSAAIWSVLNQQFIRDYVAVKAYAPSTEVTHITDVTTMTESARFIFYATRPEINSSDKFNADCRRKEMGNPILGCYAGNRIYVYNVTDQRMSGVKEVTSAHEMLHAAYDRLSSSQRTALNDELQRQYSQMNDDDLKKRMAYYQRTEPGEENNELHSILGTEFARLSPELETHYKKYFQDRSAIIALHSHYSDKFKENERERSTLKSTLDSLQTRVNQMTEQYNTSIQQLNTDIQEFNGRADAGGFSSQAAFNAERNALVRRSNDLTSTRATIANLANDYEQKRISYNALVDESNDMQKSLDSSSLAPTPSL